MRRTLGVTLLLLVALVAGASSPVHAQSSPSITCGGNTTDLQINQIVSLYNDNTGAVPDVVRPAVGSNTTELYIENAAQPYYTLQTDDSLAITDVSLGEASDADVLVQTDRATACSLYTASDPVTEFQQAYNSGDIEIEGQGTVNQAKVFVVERVMDVMNMF